MINILYYVAFGSATQTLRYEPQHFGQITIFRQIWSYLQRNHLSIKNYSHNYHSQWKLTQKLLKKLKFQENEPLWGPFLVCALYLFQPSMAIILYSLFMVFCGLFILVESVSGKISIWFYFWSFLGVIDTNSFRLI